MYNNYDIKLDELSMHTIILENNIYLDGEGDYYHCLDLLKASKTNPNLIEFTFIPIINTNNQTLRAKIFNDFKLLGITEFYIGDLNDFQKNSDLDQKLKPVYERADQVIEVSNYFAPPQRRFLKPGTVVKRILEHEKLGDGSTDGFPKGWHYHNNHPTYNANLGLSRIAQGIKIADVDKVSSSHFFSTLQKHDQHFANKLLTTTVSKNFQHFLENNTFFHGYFTDFNYIDGFSIFLALVCSNHALKHKSKDIAIHLSSSIKFPLRTYAKSENSVEEEHDSNGIRFFKLLINYIPDFDIKHIEFFGKKGEFNDTNESDHYIYPINPAGTRIVRIYSEFLSQQSFNELYDAVEMVGVSGDNTFEKSVAHKKLPFYHSTNWAMKIPTFAAIKTIIETVDFGFSEPLKNDLIIYFNYRALQSRAEYWKQLFQVDLDEIRNAWPVIATYLKNNKNFYHVYEDFIKMPAPKFNFDEVQHNFTTQLHIIADKRDKLRKDGHLNAAAVAKTLHDNLDKLSQTYFKSPTEKAYETFKKQAKNEIKKAHTELDNHRGWKQILGNIGLAILGFGIIYLIAVLVNRSMFFNKTDSSKKLDKLEQHVDGNLFKIVKGQM